MVDFVGRGNTGIYDDMGAANQYWDEAHDAAQRLWANRELRRRTDEANRYNRDEANSALDFYNQNAGLVENRPNDLAGLRPLGLQPVAPNGTTQSGPTSLRPPSAGAYTPTPAAAAPAASTLTADQRARLTASGSNPDSAERPVVVAELSPEQQQAWQAYQNAGPFDRRSMTHERTSPNLGGISQPEQTQESALRRLRSLGLDVVNGSLVRTREPITTDATGLTWPGNMQNSDQVPTADVGADVAGVSDPNHSSASEYLQYASEDTSAPLQPTYEMNLIDVAVRNSMRQARLAAQHGRNDIAQQSFNMTLQGLAAHRQQENLLLLRAAANGSERAASALISRFNGRAPGDVEVHETARGSGLYVLQMRGPDGQMRMATQGAPMTRTDLIARLQNLADRETAAAQAEVSAENERALAENRTRIQVATIQAQADMFGDMTAAETAHMQAVEARATQRAQLATFGDGGIVVVYNTVDENGQPSQGIQIIREEQLPSANVDGNRNQTTPVVTRRPAARVTGTAGVR